MKTLYESILSDIDTNMAKGDADVIIKMLFDNDAVNRQIGIEDLKKLVESYKPNQIKQMAKLNDYNGYFIEFSINEPGKKHKTKYDAVHISNKYNGYCYNINVFGWYSKKPYWLIGFNWKQTKIMYNPKRNLVYEVPHELTTLFDAIFKERDNRILSF